MERRAFLMILGGGVSAATVGAAATFEDAVVAQLRAQGYGQITSAHTLLGRVRIVAILGDTQREIILNPRTGEILRDVIAGLDGTVVPQIARASQDKSKSSSGSGSSGSDNSGSGDDSDGDDTGGNDDSGGGSGSDDSGGSNSGSGSSSGGSGSGSGHGGGGNKDQKDEKEHEDKE
jgi:hypothetical protein